MSGGSSSLVRIGYVPLGNTWSTEQSLMTEFMLTMELMLQIGSRGFCFRGWPGVGRLSPSSEHQGVWGETGDLELEQSMVSVVQDSRLRQGERQGMTSEAEVLHEGTIDASENNECREEMIAT